jgi:hypothetical protein
VTTETLVVTDAALDPDKFMLDGIDTSKNPHFTVSEVAKVFFARSSHWIRWLETKHAFILDSTDPSCPHGEPDPNEPGETLSWMEPVTLHGQIISVCTHCSGEDTAARRTEKGARVYTLGDIEKMTHALAGGGHISGAQASNALHLVRTCARIWEYLA